MLRLLHREGCTEANNALSEGSQAVEKRAISLAQRGSPQSKFVATWKINHLAHSIFLQASHGLPNQVVNTCGHIETSPNNSSLPASCR